MVVRTRPVRIRAEKRIGYAAPATQEAQFIPRFSTTSRLWSLKTSSSRLTMVPLVGLRRGQTDKNGCAAGRGGPAQIDEQIDAASRSRPAR